MRSVESLERLVETRHQLLEQRVERLEKAERERTAREARNFNIAMIATMLVFAIVVNVLAVIE
jgi:hypothetical protein